MPRTDDVPDSLGPTALRLALAVCLGVIGTIALLQSSAAAAAAGCFPRPSACGYPDATNTGVPAGTQLTASGSRTLSANGQKLTGVDLTGTVTVSADNVTIERSKLHSNDGGSGTTVIQLENGADNFTLKDSEVYGNGSTSNAPESAIWNHYDNPGATLEGVYLHGSPDNVEGSVTVRDSYLVVDAAYSGSHDENIYICSSKVDVDHSTLVNMHEQTATVFGDTICGGGNDFTVTNSLLGGGGYVLYPQANSDSAVGTMNVSGNRFARCTSPETYEPSSGGHPCQNGPDSNGYSPNGGNFGLAASYNSGNGQVWQYNVWDDDSQPVCPDGTSGCGRIQAVWRAPVKVRQGRKVTLDGTASQGAPPLRCVWTVENKKGTRVSQTRSKCKVRLRFRQAGRQYVRLTVQDGSGSTDSLRRAIRVRRRAVPGGSHAHGGPSRIAMQNAPMPR